MDLTRIGKGILVGSVFTGILYGLASCFATTQSKSSTFFGPESEWWLFALITGTAFGGVIGGFLGGLTAGFRLAIPKAIAFCAIVHLLIVAISFILFGGGGVSDAIKYETYGFLLIGMLNGTLVSLLTVPRDLK